MFTGVPDDGPVDASGDGRSSPAAPASATTADGLPFAARMSGEVARRPGRLLVACLATVLGPAVVAHAGSVGPSTTGAVRTGEAAATASASGAPAPGDLDAWRALARTQAGTCPGLPPGVLVAIGRVESSLGLQTFRSTAGAQGPMQFLPTTWAAYGADGDGDGRADIGNVADAMRGAASLLCANGGAEPDRLPSAVWHYNHSDDYVERVLGLVASWDGLD